MKTNPQVYRNLLLPGLMESLRELEQYITKSFRKITVIPYLWEDDPKSKIPPAKRFEEDTGINLAGLEIYEIFEKISDDNYKKLPELFDSKIKQAIDNIIDSGVKDIIFVVRPEADISFDNHKNQYVISFYCKYYDATGLVGDN